MAIQFYFSGGGSAQSVLGGLISSVEIPDTQGVIFPNVTTAQSKAGVTHYASIYVKNTGLETKEIFLYFDSVVTNSNIYFADSITAGLTIADQETAPTDELIFTAPTYDYSALSIGSLAAGASKQIWLKRIIKSNSAGSLNDYFILQGIEE